MTTLNKTTQADLDRLAEHMDDEIREELHHKHAPTDPLVFLADYLDLDRDFPDDQLLSADQRAELDVYRQAGRAHAGWLQADDRLEAEARQAEYAALLTEWVALPEADIDQWLTDMGPEITAPALALEHLPRRVDIRATIEAARERTGRTRTAVARAVSQRIGCHELSVMRYFRGETDGSGALIGAILDELGLEIRSRA